MVNAASPYEEVFTRVNAVLCFLQRSFPSSPSPVGYYAALRITERRFDPRTLEVQSPALVGTFSEGYVMVATFRTWSSVPCTISTTARNTVVACFRDHP